MKVLSASFTFQGWTFDWKPMKRKKIIQRRLHTRWKVKVNYKGKKFEFTVTCFSPTACRCRMVKAYIKRNYKI